jgi:hypothetical protein
MNRLLISLILVGTFLIALLVAAGPASAVNCGGGVTVKGGTPCWKAKRIVKEFRKTRERKVQGFTCGGKTSGGRVVVVNCKLQNKHIHWEA